MTIFKWINYFSLQDIHDSCEPAMFSLEQLLFSVAADSRTNNEILERIMPMIVEVYDRELTDRKKIKVCRTHKLDTLSDKMNIR